jgi:thiol-disulfide isomerase/thioredoxin
MIRTITSAVLYVALALGANPVLGEPLSREAMMELRQGDMRKLAIHTEAETLPIFTLLDMDEGEHSLDEFKGKYVLLNFWATWCAPCRKEMPSLDALQRELGNDAFEVVLIAAGRNPKPAIKKFFIEAEINTLKTLRDPTQQLANLMGVFGLPITVILSPEGLEIARMRGDANWHSDEAVAFLTALVEGTTP